MPTVIHKTVTDVPSLLFPVRYDRASLLVYQVSADFYFGGDDSVAAASADEGALVPAGGQVSCNVKAREEWWAVAPAGQTANCVVVLGEV